MKKQILILFLAAGIFASCKSTSTSTSTDNNNGGGTPTNTMIFTVGGAVDTFTTQPISNAGPTMLVIASRNGVSTGFSILNISSPGQYSIGSIAGASSVGALMNVNYLDSGSVTYSSSTNAGTPNGILNITKISSSTLQATFNDTLTLVSGNTNSPQTIVVTNGSVNIQ